LTRGKNKQKKNQNKNAIFFVFSIIHKTQAAFTTGQQTELMVKKKRNPIAM